MKIRDILAADRPVVSFEVFPPRQDAAFEPVRLAVARLALQRPAFMSVTYGAGGGANANTAAIAEFAGQCGVSALAHLTCIGSSRAKIAAEVEKLKEKGVENVLCLRGDAPADGSAPQGDFAYAADLVRELRGSGMCLGGACYPECHPECEHIEDEIVHLKEKVDAGLDFLITQMFFDNDVFYRYLAKLRSRGIVVPVMAGIMPVTNARQIKRICRLSGTYLPAQFKAIVDRFADNPAAMLDAGVAYATAQIVDLFANGANAVHLYTMNKPEVAERIMANLRSIIGE